MAYIDYLADCYGSRQSVPCRELDKIRPLGISYKKPQGGLTLWCDLDEEINEKKLYQRGLLIMPGFLFYPFGYGEAGHVRLSFSKTSEEEIVRGVAILADALRACRDERSNVNE